MNNTISSEKFLDLLVNGVMPVGPYVVEGRVELGATVFEADICFGEGTFEGHFDFSRTTFNGLVDLGQSRFLNSVDFTKSKFEKNVSFSDSRFLSYIDFSWASFHTADFGKSVFEKSIEFSESRFESDVSLGSAVFEGSRFELGQSLFGSRLDLNSAKFWCNSVSLDTAKIDKLILGRNPAIGWLFVQYQRGYEYTLEDACEMCGHSRPLNGWALTRSTGWRKENNLKRYLCP